MCSSLFCTFLCLFLHHNNVKLPSYMFYRGNVVYIPACLFFPCGSFLPRWLLEFLIFSLSFFVPTKFVSFDFISCSGSFSVIHVHVIVMWHLTSTYVRTNVRTVTWSPNFHESIGYHFLTHGAAPNQEVEKWNIFNVRLLVSVNSLLTHRGQKCAELGFHCITMAVGYRFKLGVAFTSINVLYLMIFG